MMQKLHRSMQPSCTFTYARCRRPNVDDAGRHVGHAEAAQQIGQLALVGDDFATRSGSAATSCGARVA